MAMDRPLHNNKPVNLNKIYIFIPVHIAPKREDRTQSDDMLYLPKFIKSNFSIDLNNIANSLTNLSQKRQYTIGLTNIENQHSHSCPAIVIKLATSVHYLTGEIFSELIKNLCFILQKKN